MAIETRIDEEAYLRLAFAEPDRKWELVDGRLREKPAMTFRHNQWEITVGFAIRSQLDLSVYEVRIDAGRLRKPGATCYIPDVFVFPLAFATEFKDRDDVLEVYDGPLPLVVEIWSRSTGDYDVEEKLADYQGPRRCRDLAPPPLRADADAVGSAGPTAATRSRSFAAGSSGSPPCPASRSTSTPSLPADEDSPPHPGRLSPIPQPLPGPPRSAGSRVRQCGDGWVEATRRNGGRHGIPNHAHPRRRDRAGGGGGDPTGARRDRRRDRVGCPPRRDDRP
jgi:hypothetical protein